MIWDSLKTWADADKDNAVSADEWCQMWSSDGNSEWQQRYMDFMFNLEDTSGNKDFTWMILFQTHFRRRFCSISFIYVCFRFRHDYRAKWLVIKCSDHLSLLDQSH